MNGYREIGIDDMRFQIPSEWNSMSIDQLRFLAGLLDRKRSSWEVCSMMLLHTIGAAAFSLETDIADFCIKIGSRRFPVTPEQFGNLAEIYCFLFDSVYGAEPRIAPHLTNNPFPQINCPGGRILLGADYSMFSIPFGRYIWLQTHLSGIQFDDENLPMALACVWCHDPSSLEPSQDDARLISSLPAWQQLVMFWFVSGSLENIHARFPRVFSSGGSAAGGNVLDQQLRLLDSLSGGDMTKKDQVRAGKLIDALYTIDESLRKKEEHDCEMEKLNLRRK